jgi:predicted Fe-Mo cluster-binding NifX family protein
MIAVTSSGTSLESKVDAVFGRARFFVLVDEEVLSFEAIENTGASGSGGVGPMAAQILMEKGVKAVITGNMGPNAFQALEQGQVPVFNGEGMTLLEAVVAFNEGKLRRMEAPTSAGHHG